MSQRRHIGFITISVALVSMAGCAADGGDQETGAAVVNERAGQITQALPIADCTDCFHVDPTWPIAAGTCGYQGGGTLAPIEAQKRVTAAWRYVIGAGPSPTSIYTCSGSSLLSSNLSYLKTALKDELCEAYSPTKQTVCGLTASVYQLYCEGLTSTKFNKIGAIAASMDDCWGVGASGLWATDDGSGWKQRNAAGVWEYGLSLAVDPSPARLTTPLSGSYGASAAAYYLDTGAGTTVVKWSPTYMPGGWPAGMACATGDLGTSSDALRSIYVSTSGLRKCM